MDSFDGTWDFSLWKVRMLSHFGSLGLKMILTDEKLLKDPPSAREDSSQRSWKLLQRIRRRG